MKAIKIALPLTFLVAVAMLEGCGGAEPSDEPELMALTKFLTGSEEGMKTAPTTQDGASLTVTWENTMYTNDATPFGGRLRFSKDGDLVQVCDIDADGWTVRAAWQPSGGGLPFCGVHVTGGNGTCLSLGASTSPSCNLPENTSIRFGICLRRGDDARGCDYATWSSG